MMLYNIPPSLTTTVQLYVRNSDNTVGSAVGSPISGTSSGSTYTYTLGSYASGDYFAILTGVSNPVGTAFPVRDDIGYPTLTWGILDLITLTDSVVVTDVTQPTAADGKLTRPIIIGDDYLEAVGGRHFQWTVNEISGYSASDLACKFGGKFGSYAWNVTGSVSTVTGGIRLKFDLPKSVTQTLVAGHYDWSVEVSTVVGGYEVTRVSSKEPVLVKEKQT